MKYINIVYTVELADVRN